MTYEKCELLSDINITNELFFTDIYDRLNIEIEFKLKDESYLLEIYADDNNPNGRDNIEGYIDNANFNRKYTLYNFSTLDIYKLAIEWLLEFINYGEDKY